MGTPTMMNASTQPISAVYLSHAKSKDDYCRQTTQDVDSPTEEIHPTLKDQDPFLYYSNDRVRMTELRLQDVKDDSSHHGPSSSSLSSPQEQSTTTCARKTKITFELHPHLLLEDLMEELFLDDSFDFNDILDASLVADEKDLGSVDDVMNGLREIILG